MNQMSEYHALKRPNPQVSVDGLALVTPLMTIIVKEWTGSPGNPLRRGINRTKWQSKEEGMTMKGNGSGDHTYHVGNAKLINA
jgi:hypothetical protein